MRISVFESKELQGTILALKGMEKELSAQIRKATKDVSLNEWKTELARQATTPLERKVLVGTAKVAVSNQNISLKVGAAKRLSGGGTAYQLTPGTEFGSDRGRPVPHTQVEGLCRLPSGGQHHPSHRIALGPDHSPHIHGSNGREEVAMARKGITIPIASDTRSFMKGVDKGLIDPLENAVDAIDDVAKAMGDASDATADLGRDGARSLDKLEDSLKDAQRETEELKDDHRDLNDAIAKGSKTSYKKMDDAADDGFHKVNEAAETTKDESKAAFGEMAGSFDGSMDSMVGSAQGLMGGLAASGGPIALAAGAIGLSAGVFYNMWKANAKTKQRVADMYQDMLDSQQDFLSDGYKVEEYWKILKGDDGAVLSLKKVDEYAERTGLTAEQVALAWAGDSDLMTRFDGPPRRTPSMRTATRPRTLRATRSSTTSSRPGGTRTFSKATARGDEIDDTITAVKTGKAAWTNYGSEASKQVAGSHREMGIALGKDAGSSDAVNHIPTTGLRHRQGRPPTPRTRQDHQAPRKRHHQDRCRVHHRNGRTLLLMATTI